MLQILAAFGAIGQQRGSVIDHVLRDAGLPQQYRIRAVTRDPSSEKAKGLKAKNIEVIQGDVFDLASLGKALEGVHTVFLVATPSSNIDAVAEVEAARNVPDISLERGVHYLIFSTLPSPSTLSGGKYTKIAMFDAKARAEDYIRNLPIKSAFYSPGSFMQNYISFAAPRKASDGSNAFVMAFHCSPKTRIPLIDAASDTGKFVEHILANPEEYEGKTVYGAGRTYSLEEMAAIFSKVTKEDVVYSQLSVEEFKASLPFDADIITEAYGYYQDFGYYGKDTEALVAAVDKNTSERLTTFEQFLVKQNFTLH
ncbi:Hscarg dehydrogenase [Fusarium sp. LHS14.1]|nr:Hscarg dehydrogenase [Fusarium sp. LHS14.1]